MKKECILGGIGLLLVGMLLGHQVTKMSHKGHRFKRAAMMRPADRGPQKMWNVQSKKNYAKSKKKQKSSH